MFPAGCFLAYRFPELRVCCVDMERRACFAHYQEAFLAEGKPAPGHINALDNTLNDADDFSARIHCASFGARVASGRFAWKLWVMGRVLAPDSNP